jgi:hypothetical protein
MANPHVQPLLYAFGHCIIAQRCQSNIDSLGVRRFATESNQNMAGRHSTAYLRIVVGPRAKPATVNS